MEFKPGDVVKLKSGGPAMTVVALDSGLVCIWFAEDKSLQRATINPIAVQSTKEKQDG